MAVSDILASAKSLVGLGRYKYSALPEHQQGTRREPGQLQSHVERLDAFRRTHKFMMLGLMGFAIFFVLAVSSAGNTLNKNNTCDTVVQGYTCAPSISRSWGQYSPFFAVKSEMDPGVPEGCTVTFAQVLSRHGARDPTDTKSEAYAALVAKIQGRVQTYSEEYSFLEGLEYTLGQDQLTVFGEREMRNSGIKFYQRYQDLAASSAAPFFRASGQDRVVESAKNFSQGFHGSKVDDVSAGADEAWPYEMVIISEAEGQNNTLDHGLCTAFEEGAVSEIGDDSKAEWAAVFIPPIQTRVNEKLPGANLTVEETIFLMDMCPFTTVADEEGEPSEFCGLFTADEWESYGYYQSLDKWYGYGPGNPLGPTQGVGWVNELIARLTTSPVEDDTSTNSTMDDDPATFPLGKKMYADFSHDNTMVSVFSALGLFSGTEDLSKTVRQGVNETGGFSASRVVPFGSRLYVEKMTCEDTGEGTEMVRFLLNDRVMPLDGCGSYELGRCRLDEFVESMAFAEKGGLWDSCFV